MTFWGETEHFSGKNGALRWSIFVGKQKHNVQKPKRCVTSKKRLRGILLFTEINMFLANPDIINNSFKNGLNKSGLQLNERGNNIMMFFYFVNCLSALTGRLDFLAHLNL